MKKMYEIYISNCFNEYERYIFKGTKEQLMTLIGCLYSTSTIKIERIDYREVEKIPRLLCKEMRYVIQNDNVYVITANIEREEQEND